jgi:putative ABC transport system permease protein
MINKMALRNLFRNKARTIVALFSITIAVMFAVIMLSFINGIISSYMKNYINFQYGNIRVANTKFFDKEDYFPIKYTAPESLADKISKIEGVKSVSKRIKVPVLIGYEEDSKQALLFGIDIKVDEEILKLKRSLKEGEYIDNKNTCIIGITLSNKLNVKTGDTILIVSSDRFSSLNAIKLVISGIFDLDGAYFNSKLIFTSYKNAQILTRAYNKITEIVIMTNNDYHNVTKTISKDLPEEYKAVPVDKSGQLYFWFKLALSIYRVISFGIILLGGMIIINTMLMIVNERKREIGMLKAMGMDNLKVEKLFMTEAFYLGVAGSFLGTILGGIASYNLSIKGIVIPDMGDMDFMIQSHLYGEFSIPVLIFMFAAGIILTTMITYLPVKSGVNKEAVDLLER